jgi:hypothetical protein
MSLLSPTASFFVKSFLRGRNLLQKFIAPWTVSKFLNRRFHEIPNFNLKIYENASECTNNKFFTYFRIKLEN